MASLTHTAYISRNIIKFGGIGVLGFVSIYWILGMVWKAYLVAHPPYIAPTVRFGILPKIIFSQKNIKKGIAFTTELPNDSFPKFNDQAKVFVIYRSKSIVGALEKAKITAEAMGFHAEPNQIGTGVYEFNDNLVNRKLTMNVLADSFKLSYNYLNDQTLLNPEKLPNKIEAVSLAKTFLSTAGKLYKDLDEGTTLVTYWKIDFESLTEVKGFSDANIIRVDFLRKQIDGDKPIVSELPDKSSVSVLLSGSSVAGKKIVEVNYKYINVDESAPSTYPIKTSEVAFSDLKNGYYWPAKETSLSSIVIRKISLGYFEPITPVQFLLPVYIFEGDDGFVAYVPAVIEKYTE